jgi:hypothetical protein
MALKHIITATEHTALNDALKGEYKLQPDMSYKLDLGEGLFITDKDPSGLMSALEKEREETRKAKAAADRLEAERKEAERAGLTNLEDIKAHFQKELEERDKRAAAEKKEIEKARLAQQQVSADQAKKTKALELASTIFGSNAPIMLPHIEMALKAVAGETPKVEIIDPATGMPSLDQNFDNFKTRLLTNPLYAPMIVVSKASGGSANDGKSTGLPSGTKDDGKPKTYADYSPAELLALKREKPELFTQLKSTKG